MAANTQILRQYLDDYSNAATKFNRASQEYQASMQYQGGPKVAKNAAGESFGLWDMPSGNVQRVYSGPYQQFASMQQDQIARQSYVDENQLGRFIADEKIGDFGQPYRPEYPQAGDTGSWTQSESQSGSAIRGSDGGYYTDVGSGLAARRTGGVGTGEFITERRSGGEWDVEGLRQSGLYKDVKYIQVGTDGDGNPIGYIDVTYERMAFPDKPAPFDKKVPTFTIQQEKALKGEDTSTMADIDRQSDGVIGAILSQAKKPRGAGLISGSMD